MSKRANQKAARRRVRRQNAKSDAQYDSMRAVRRLYGGGKAR